jgi:CubicO group peptidase (beta-lactamase class C family)
MNKSPIQKNISKQGWRVVTLFAAFSLALSTLASCGPSPQDLQAIKYAPIVRDDWSVSTPEAQGLDPMLVSRMYYDAAKHETIYSLLVVKNGYLVAEDYFNAGSIDELGKRASVTKSYTSAMLGIALDKGYISNIDEKMLDYFPDIRDRVTDPRKFDITIRNMLEMRAGYPSEEHDATAWDIMWSGDYLGAIASLPLSADPGTRFQYSNLTAHYIGIIVARATGTDKLTFGNEYLFGPLGVHAGEGWLRDVDGYYIGGGDIMFTARDMAKFGLLYLNKGEYNGRQLVSSEWVEASLQTYTVNEFEVTNVGHFKNMGYGYQWWSADVGEHKVNFAWGHGGQLIVLVHDLNMVIVTAADSFWGKDIHFDSWSYESAIMKMVSDYIYQVPVE